MANEPVPGTVTSASLRRATGLDWPEWMDELDAAGAASWDHKEIVAHLRLQHPEVDSSWWRQTIAVTYERARCDRVVERAPKVVFQAGVQRRVDATVSAVWRVLTSRPELWLGGGALTFTRGASYEVSGATGQVMLVKPDDRLRLTWQPEGWEQPATVQLSLIPSGSGRTALLLAHVDRLPDAPTREQVRARWRDALDRIATAAVATATA